MEIDEEVDKDKAKALLKKILALEQENLKTKHFNNEQMVEKIKKMIEEEIRKCF